MLVFAAMFHLFRYGRAIAKSAPPKIITAPPKAAPPAISPPSTAPSLTTPSKDEKPLVTPAAQKSLGASAAQSQAYSQGAKSAPATTKSNDAKISAAPSSTDNLSEPIASERNITGGTHQTNVGTSNYEIPRKNLTDDERRKI